MIADQQWETVKKEDTQNECSLSPGRSSTCSTRGPVAPPTSRQAARRRDAGMTGGDPDAQCARPDNERERRPIRPPRRRRRHAQVLSRPPRSASHSRPRPEDPHPDGAGRARRCRARRRRGAAASRARRGDRARRGCSTRAPRPGGDARCRGRRRGARRAARLGPRTRGRLQQCPHLRVAVGGLLDGFAVDAERDVIQKDAAVHLATSIDRSTPPWPNASNAPTRSRRSTPRSSAKWFRVPRERRRTKAREPVRPRPRPERPVATGHAERPPRLPRLHRRGLPSRGADRARGR